MRINNIVGYPARVPNLGIQLQRIEDLGVSFGRQNQPLAHQSTRNPMIKAGLIALVAMATQFVPAAAGKKIIQPLITVGQPWTIYLPVPPSNNNTHQCVKH